MEVPNASKAGALTYWCWKYKIVRHFESYLVAEGLKNS